MSWVLYGAYGYTGTLLAEEAVRRGHRPTLAGRSAEKLEPLARRLGLPFRAVGLDDPKGLRELLAGQGAVLHAAGPFVRTSRPMADACLEVGASYLDITGELPVFEALYARDGEARAKGVALIPGVGFDVVPTDCLAVWLAGRVRAPRSLLLCLNAVGQPSAGTARSAVGLLPTGGLVRRGGELIPWPLGRGLQQVHFSHRDLWVLPLPLADLASAWRSTRIPDITTCLAPPRPVVQLLRTSWRLADVSMRLLGPVLRTEAVRRRLEAWAGARAVGPDAAQRAQGRSFVYGRVDGEGERAEGWLETCEGYDFTAQSGVRSVERVLAERPVGALSPAMAFGADFALEVEERAARRSSPHRVIAGPLGAECTGLGGALSFSRWLRSASPSPAPSRWSSTSAARGCAPRWRWCWWPRGPGCGSPAPAG